MPFRCDAARNRQILTNNAKSNQTSWGNHNASPKCKRGQATTRSVSEDKQTRLSGPSFTLQDDFPDIWGEPLAHSTRMRTVTRVLRPNRSALTDFTTIGCSPYPALELTPPFVNHPSLPVGHHTAPRTIDLAPSIQVWLSSRCMPLCDNRLAKSETPRPGRGSRFERDDCFF